jgi:peptidoglycan/xylan/chitin deacetylase (PgdA/CDA1 family)
MEEDVVDDPAGLLQEKGWGSAVQSDGKIEGYYIRSTFCSGQALTRLTGSISEDNRVVFTAVFPGRSEDCAAMGIPFHVEYVDMVESFEGLYDPNKKTVTGTFKAFQDRKYTVVYEGDEDWGYTYYAVDDTGITRTGTFTIDVQPKEFMITFDDGPVPGNTRRIVDALNNIYVDGKPVKAGFFMVGCNDGCEDKGASRVWMDCLPPIPGCGWLAPWPLERWRTKGSVHDNGDIVRYVASRPAEHIIGNHTEHHMWFWWRWPWGSEDVKNEISACDNELKSALAPDGRSPAKVFRPPYFVYNSDVRKGTDPGLQVIMGAGNDRGSAVDSLASSVKDVEDRARDLIQSWHGDEPCVLTFHDISPVTPDNIAEIIRYLRRHEVTVLGENVEEGFTLVHFDPSRLPWRPESLVHQATNIIHPSQTARHTIPLDSTVSAATFNVSWQGSDLDLVLYRPDGTRVDPARALVDSRVKYAERDTYEYYTVSQADAGAWVMVVSSVSVPPEGEKYTITVEGETDLALFAFTDKAEYQLGEWIGIRAELMNAENRMSGASAMARVRRPDASVDDLTLYDDGMHGDENANDGFYANAYGNTSLRGSYEITVTATGSLAIRRYERVSDLTVMVGSIAYSDVDFGAYAVLANRWMACDCMEPAWCDTADLDQSGAVGVFDLRILAERWLELAP